MASLAQIIRLPDVKSQTGFSKSTICRRIRAGLFPKPVNLGSRAVGWPASEIELINSARISGKNNKQIQELVAHLHSTRRVAML